jgi:hypothetical protein
MTGKIKYESPFAEHRSRAGNTLAKEIPDLNICSGTGLLDYSILRGFPQPFSKDGWIGPQNYATTVLFRIISDFLVTYH